jgi:thiol-disulfide isomerase/thioredoxin
MRILQYGIIVSLLFGMYGCLGYAPPRPKQLPDIQVKELSGKVVKLTSYQKKVLIINFWATWCGPCKEEIPEFNELYESYRKDNVMILGITKDSTEDVQEFLKDHTVRYPLIVEADQAEDAFSVSGYPMTYVYDAKGQLFTQAMGLKDKSFFEDAIKQLLK